MRLMKDPVEAQLETEIAEISRRIESIINKVKVLDPEKQKTETESDN